MLCIEFSQTQNKDKGAFTKQKKIKFTLEGKEFTLNDYVMHPITETGYYSTSSGQWEINMSSIYTYLIHRVGRYTENYASDLIHVIDAINKALRDRCELDGKKSLVRTFLVGIRYDGVDGNDSIAAKIRNRNDLSREYIDGVYILKFEQYDTEMKVTFGKTSFYG